MYEYKLKWVLIHRKFMYSLELLGKDEFEIILITK